MSALKKLAGQTALYGLSSIVGRALNFLLVPFYTSVLSIQDFGVMTDLYVYMAFLNIIYLFGMETTYFKTANDQGENIAFNHAFTWILIIGVILSSFFIIGSHQIAQLLSYPQLHEYIILMAIILLIDGVCAIPFAQLRFKEKPLIFASAKVSNIIINIKLNIFFLVICSHYYESTENSALKNLVMSFYDPNFKVGYILLSNLIANVLFIPFLWKSFLSYRPKVSLEYMKPMAKYAYPLAILGIAGMINEMIDRILLKEIFPKHLYPNKTNMEVLGIYGGIYKLSIFITLVRQAFQYAAEPFFFSKAKDRNAPETFATVMKYYALFCCLMFLFISLYRDLIGGILLQNDVFQEGLYILPFLLLANVFLGIYYNQSVWYKLTEKTYYGTIITIIGATITIVLNLLLIPQFGYFACAITTLVCYASMSIISYFLGQKYYPIPYPVGKILFYILLSTVLIIISFIHPYQTNTLQNLGINTGLLVCFLVVIAYQEKSLLIRKRQ
ncbi:MAG: polysaccharide biosynthesis protein [Cytophagales bacterium]|nr:polysaccharide biosynthesis protein [Cytophagales bacterium]